VGLESRGLRSASIPSCRTLAFNAASSLCAALSLWAALWLAACREASRTVGAPPVTEVSSSPAPSGASLARAELSEREPSPEADAARDLTPPDAPHQRLAFSRGRLAWLRSDELRVWSLADLSLASQFRAPGARNVVALTGGGFLVAGDEHLYRLSPADQRPELLPRAPRLGPTLIIPSRLESEQFWLYYAGIAELPRFDLGGPPRIAALPMLDWTELFEFDRRALLGLGDGSFVYTTVDGLRRIDVEGRREPLPHPELAGRIWALARDERLDRVWAVTEQHLYLLHVRERVQVLRRFELGPHPVALAADAGTVAVLRIDRLEPREVRAIVDVFVEGAAPPRVVRLDADPPAADAGLPPRFLPEVALSASEGWLAATGFGLQVHDYRRGVRVSPREPDAQKLAPAAP